MDDRQRGETAMLGRVDTGSALGSGAVDADFWALVCEDEEWLDAEFDAIVGAAWEGPWRSGRRSRIGVAWPGRGMRGQGPTRNCPAVSDRERPGRRRRRVRDPPGTG